MNATQAPVSVDGEAEARAKRAASTEHLQNPFVQFAIRMALGTSLHPVVNRLPLDDLKKLERAVKVLPGMVNETLNDIGLPRLGPGESVWTNDVLPLVQRRLRQLERKPRTDSKGDIFEQIKAAVSIEDFAGRFTDLSPSGSDTMKGVCPLHSERTPSFVVYLSTDTWRCFGACADGGDVIALAQRLIDKGLLQ